MIKKNITLILGLSIPILMIILVAGSIYIPRLFLKPQHNFVYVSGDNYYYGGPQYSVTNGKIEKTEIKQPEKVDYYSPKIETKLFVYDVVKDTSKEVTYDEVKNLNIDSNLKSPDGFEVADGNGGGGFFPLFYGGGQDYNKYLKGHGGSKKINLQFSGSTNYYNFRFLGWIK